MRVWAIAVMVVTTAGCKADQAGGNAAPAPTGSGPMEVVDTGPPIVANFIDLTEEPVVVPLTPCHDEIVTVVKGTAKVFDEDLAVGDIVVVSALGLMSYAGKGAILEAKVRRSPCLFTRSKHVVRAAAAPELTFMNGGMHAHLDLDPTVSPTAYMGRLSGTAAVPEHAHAGTWEALCSIEGSGIFTLAGQAQRLLPHGCVTVPADAKHSWQPDKGATLNAVQIYWPPGPEQRFKKLAADEASSVPPDAGRPPEAGPPPPH